MAEADESPGSVLQTGFICVTDGGSHGQVRQAHGDQIGQAG